VLCCYVADVVLVPGNVLEPCQPVSFGVFPAQSPVKFGRSTRGRDSRFIVACNRGQVMKGGGQILAI
jgi:hypothetical protein